jgi:hypothetical protein
MIERNLGRVLRQAAEHYPVVTVTGPRQSAQIGDNVTSMVLLFK